MHDRHGVDSFADSAAVETADEREITRLKRVFGLSYIWQGASGLVSTPMTFFVKEVLALSDAWGQIFTGATTIGWLIKPLWGWISDSIPIGGRRRKPWFIIMALCAASAWCAAAIGAWSGATAPLYFFVVFNMASVGAAFVDVVGDALMVENGQRLRKVTKFVNHQWTMLALSLSVAGFVGGWLTGEVRRGTIDYAVVFVVAAILPVIAAYVGFAMIREKRRPKTAPAPKKRTKTTAGPWHQRVRGAWGAHSLLFTLLLFMFFWNFNPSVGYIQRSYLIDHRAFTPEIFGTIMAINGLVLLASLVCYRALTRVWKNMPWQYWLYAVVVISLFAVPTNFFMYLEPSHQWWSVVHALVPDMLRESPLLPDWNQYVWFVVATGSIIAFAQLPAFMIPLKLAGVGINSLRAGLQYALLMSTINLTHTIDDMLGGIIYGWFGVLENVAGNATGARILALFRTTPLEIAGSADARTLILEIFVWTGAFCTVISIPFIGIVRRAFQKRGLALSLKE